MSEQIQFLHFGFVLSEDYLKASSHDLGKISRKNKNKNIHKKDPLKPK